MSSKSLYCRSFYHTDGFLEFIDLQGGNSRALFEAVGLAYPPYKSKIHFCSFTALCDMWELAAEQLDDPNIGFKWAFEMPEDYRSSGATMFVGFIAKSMKNFLDIAVDYQKVHTNGVNYSYTVENNSIFGFVDFHPLSPPHRVFCEHIMAGIIIMARRHIPEVKTNYVNFQHSAPKDQTWYEKTFQCPVNFNCDRNMISVADNILDHDTNPHVFNFFKVIAGSYVNIFLKSNRPSESPISFTVSRTLPSIFGMNNSDIKTMASSLNMHPKKLQRLLQDEGRNYSDILDETRQSMAVWLLSNSDISIGRVATMLDYSSDRAFGAATKRWFNQSPRAYRNSQKTLKTEPNGSD